MGKAGMYCAMALLLPMTILAGAINPERAGHLSQAPIIQSHGRVHRSAQSLAVHQGADLSGQAAAPGHLYRADAHALASRAHGPRLQRSLRKHAVKTAPF